jgi:tetratricopeptide (TPR) repeat protein
MQNNSGNYAALDDACGDAMNMQLTGRLDLAEQRYRSILQAQPDHAIANHCLGLLLMQLQRPAKGLPFLSAALDAHPENPEYWLGYLEALLQAGQIETAHEALALGRQHGLSSNLVDEFAARLLASVRRHGARPYIVLAPAYTHQSAGIRVLHTLCNELNACGHTAYLIFYRFRPGGGHDFYTTDENSHYCSQHEHIPRLTASNDIARFRTLIESAYVVYPEVIQANPLNAPRVVRYVLNSPASNGYPMFEDERDFIVSFSEQYWQKPNWIAFLVIDDPTFNDGNTRPALERTMDCTYIGKGVKFGDCFRIPGSVGIERNWPSDKEGLAIMLRNTRYFYTWDVVSQTNIDAVLCGAIPVVMRWSPVSAAAFEAVAFPYAETGIENGILKIVHNSHEFELKRRHYVDSYRSAADGRTRTVDRLAKEIEQHFDHGESPALNARPAEGAARIR